MDSQLQPCGWLSSFMTINYIAQGYSNIITGNYDNIPRFNKLDTMLAFDGVVGRMSSTVFHLKNGNIYNINGKSYFIMGGGFSIDKQRRTPGVTWWPEEMPNHEEYKLGIDSLNKVNHKVDYLLTHTCSTSEFDDICDEFGTRLLKIAGEEELRDYLEVVIQETQYLRHYYGHFHRSDTTNIDGIIHRVLGVGELWEEREYEE